MGYQDTGAKIRQKNPVGRERANGNGQEIRERRRMAMNI